MTKKVKKTIFQMSMEQLNKENSAICDICGLSRTGGHHNKAGRSHAACSKIRQARYLEAQKESKGEN